MITQAHCNLRSMCGRYALHANPEVVRLQFGLGFLRPYPAERMRAHAVSPRVNRPEHDDAALIESITAAPG